MQKNKLSEKRRVLKNKRWRNVVTESKRKEKKEKKSNGKKKIGR